MKKSYSRAYTLLEIMVSAIILVLGITFLMKMMFWSKVQYKKFEDDSLGMNVAYVKLQEFLAQSYETLGTKCSSGHNSCTRTPNTGGFIGNLLTETGEDNKLNLNVNWTAQVNKNYEDGALKRIPFKEIELRTNYFVRDTEGLASLKERQVRLTHIIPYPLIHSQYLELNGAGSAPVDNASCISPPCTASTFRGTNPIVDNHGRRLSLTVNYEVPKYVWIYFNIVLDVRNADGVGVFDTLYTTVRVMDASGNIVNLNPTQRTLVLSQRVINGVVSYRGILKMPENIWLGTRPNENYNIEVFWGKDPSMANTCEIAFQEANLIVVAYERDVF